MSLDTPVAFFVFNRPEHTARVFARIAQSRPRRLLLVADGPRNDIERAACEAARAVVSRVDWECEVSNQFSDVNLGCKRRMSSGITWVFSQVERAILLEDDCLPDPTFFPFCHELLERYADDERVGTISGCNFQFGVGHTPDSYYFSAIHHIWGWASWRRSWQHYDVNMSRWPTVAESDFPGDLLPASVAAVERRNMADTYAGKIDTWDFQWTFSCWLRRALCVLPEVNLISNIGYGAGATHTRKVDHLAELATEAIGFPLRHPGRLEHCRVADEAFFSRRHKKAA